MNRTAAAATPILCIIGFDFGRDLGSLVFSIIFTLKMLSIEPKTLVAALSGATAIVIHRSKKTGS
jgi:hypothetical protein